MNVRRRTLGLVTLLCSLTGSSWAQTAPIKVGVILPLSGGVFKETVFGDVNFAANGQMQSRTHAFNVQDGRIVVQK